MTAIKIDRDLVRELAALLQETGLSELEYAQGDVRIRVARAGPAMVAPEAPAVAPGRGGAEPRPEPATEAAHPGAITSPMVGVAYVRPEPGAETFVKVGDRVVEGQTVLLIEAMKTFNPIRAPRAGTVARVLVSDGAPVEYGEVLMILE
ncbi:MAG: acetyl-CoA carboxylase biotin carboxyl carrier protein [Proteobacteria bacterium]|nr:acetyl-CoA carboxylase biotin carboxyl carrier protein [Pseudomonadota bacterium]